MNILTQRWSTHLKDDIVIEPFSQRIKVYKLPPFSKWNAFLASLYDFSVEQSCDKLIFYVKNKERSRFEKAPFICEGEIKGFFRGADAFIYSWFLEPGRARPVDQLQEDLVLQNAVDFSAEKERSLIPTGYTMRHPGENDAEEMARLYRSVFRTYPTPMHDPQFIRDVMKEEVYFTIMEHEGNIVSACSADVLESFQSAEMSDCATHPEHRNQGLLSTQFSYLIQQMQRKGLWSLFSYSRSLSFGMNLVNVYHGFEYGGTMVRNSNIAGQLESMNIWYRQLRTR
ncbi:putative beta-lysine N-acetyltransferase [Salibacterium lacus]|uniref:Beta-lysine N-acetyltransferase n=1 Tax=Salibacterium lacus TaxID=1898109 RepID=A0ABW5SZ84_9BACI